MRHRIAGNKLNRNSSLRKATVRDIAKATLIQQRICTTKAKAKEARKLVDQLITMGKNGTLAEKRRAFAILCNHKVVSELFTKTSPRFKDRVGGYTRIIPLGNRRGDNAELVFLELTEKDEVIVSKPKAKKASIKKDSTQTTEVVEKDSLKEKKASKKDFSEVSKTQGEKSEATKIPKGKSGAEKETKSGKKTDKPASGLKNIFRRKAS